MEEFYVVGFGRKFLSFEDALLCAKSKKMTYVHAYNKDNLKFTRAFNIKTNKWEIA